uniref:Uncharacterized protein n=1 Tax=Setaria viridis TaxID=4556 RepID=A0A4U6VZM2_SETVI|nr:hypothetical protein SEVIR_2G379101v2 [Setaria viridis]
MQAPRPTAPVQQGQVRRGGGMLQQRMVVVSGQHPQWPGGDHMPQWTDGDTNLQRCSVDNLNLPGGPPMAALADDDFNSVSSDPSAAFEQAAKATHLGMSQAIEVGPAAPSARPNHKR